MAALITRIADGTISNNGAKQVFEVLWSEEESEALLPLAIRGRRRLKPRASKQMSDTGELEKILTTYPGQPRAVGRRVPAGKEKGLQRSLRGGVQEGH